MADFDDLPGYAPPPTRPSSAIPVERERKVARPEVHEGDDETLWFRLRLVLRRVAGSSTVTFLLAALLAGGATFVTRASGRPPPPEPHRIDPAPPAPAGPAPEVPSGSLTVAPERSAPPARPSRRERRAGKTTFRFSSGGGSDRPAAPAAPQTTRPPGSGADKPSPQPSPSPSRSPYTPTSILMRLEHPNGAYFFTTSHSAAMEKEGYEGYLSERAALVWAERRGPTMIRLELSDDSVGFIYARESDVPSGDPAPLYAASTRRYGRYYSLDREEAAEIGPVVIYGWVARY